MKVGRLVDCNRPQPSTWIRYTWAVLIVYRCTYQPTNCYYTPTNT